MEKRKQRKILPTVAKTSDKEFFKELKKRIGSPRSLEFIRYRQFLVKMHDYMTNKVIEEGSLELPARLGKIYISGKKTKNTSFKFIDWNSTKIYRESNPDWKDSDVKFVYHDNWHTDGIYYKVRWRCVKPKSQRQLCSFFKSGTLLKKGMSKKVVEGKEYPLEETIIHTKKTKKKNGESS